MAILASDITHPNCRESSRTIRRIATNVAKTAIQDWRNCQKILGVFATLGVLGDGLFLPLGTCDLKLIAIPAAAYVGNVGGGIERAIRRNSDNSAASAERPADTKCQFSAALP